MPGKEKPAEHKYLKEMRKRGWWAEHIDCGVDGFPDALAMKNDLSVLVEVKDGARTRLARNLFEASQPVQFHRLNDAGNTVFLLVAHGDEFKLYGTDVLLLRLLQDEDILVSELDECASGSIEEIADWLDEWGSV